MRTRINVRVLVAGAATAALLIAACGGAPGTGNPGGTQPPEAARSSPADGSASGEARRIVSLVPAVTEMIFAIGAGPRVVGVGSFDAYPPEVLALPKVGALIDPDLERIITLKPDMVVLHSGQTDLAEKLRRVGIRSFPYALGGLDNVTGTIDRLGEVTGARQEARRLADAIDARLEAVRRRVAGRPRPATLLVFSRERGTLRSVYASGGVGFLHDLVALSGGQDVFADVKRESLQATTETILAAAPEVIIELRYGTSVDPARLDAERDSWRVLSAVPAVRNRRVHLLVGDELVVPGPRVAATAERFAEVLHPGLPPRTSPIR